MPCWVFKVLVVANQPFNNFKYGSSSFSGFSPPQVGGMSWIILWGGGSCPESVTAAKDLRGLSSAAAEGCGSWLPREPVLAAV